MNQLLAIPGVQGLVNSRSHLKFQVKTMIERTQNQNGLTAEMLARNEFVVRRWSDDVHSISQRITNILDQEGIEPDNEERLADMEQIVNFYADVNQELSELASRFNAPNAAVAAAGQAGALDAAALV